jgi:hypothetical protein
VVWERDKDKDKDRDRDREEWEAVTLVPVPVVCVSALDAGQLWTTNRAYPVIRRNVRSVGTI